MNNFRKHKHTNASYCHITIIPYQYKCTLTLIDEMFEIVVKDFPSIKRADIEVVQQGGDYCKKIYALEFSVPVDAKIPDDYIEAKINPTLG